MDSSNEFLVVPKPDGGVRIDNYLPKHFTHDQSLRLAVWLVSMTDPTRKDFDRMWQALAETRK